MQRFLRLNRRILPRVRFYSEEVKNEQPATDSASENKKPSEIEAFEAKITEKDKQITQLQDAYRRSLADMENLRQRTRKEVEASSVFAIQKFAKDLLESADVLQMALKATPENEIQGNKALGDLHKGVLLTRNELLKCFKRFGIEEFEATGEKFDPNRHQALFKAPNNKMEPGTVMQTVKSGFMIHERVLRPAQVGVVADE